jgi:hypothetical protein
MDDGDGSAPVSIDAACGALRRARCSGWRDRLRLAATELREPGPAGPRLEQRFTRVHFSTTFEPARDAFLFAAQRCPLSERQLLRGLRSLQRHIAGRPHSRVPVVTVCCGTTADVLNLIGPHVEANTGCPVPPLEMHICRRPSTQSAATDPDPLDAAGPASRSQLVARSPAAAPATPRSSRGRASRYFQPHPSRPAKVVTPGELTDVNAVADCEPVVRVISVPRLGLPPCATVACAPAGISGGFDADKI